MRLKDVAEVAGMSSASVLYYFENGIDSLLSEMYRTMTARYAESRRADIDAFETPRDQLVAAIRNGIPTGADDEEAAVFWQMDAFVGSDPLYDVLGTQSFEEQASVYERILAVGQGRGEFVLAAHPRDVARAFVALEDGLGRQVIGSNPGVDRRKALELLGRFATLAVGAEIDPSE